MQLSVDTYQDFKKIEYLIKLEQKPSNETILAGKSFQCYQKNFMLRNNSTIKVGIIGLGREQHIYGYELHPKCKVVKICDFNLDKLLEVKQRHPNQS